MEEKGFSLIEVIAAVFVLLTGVIACYAVFFQMTKDARFVTPKLTAAYLAQEGIEIIRNMRDTNWLSAEENWDEGLTNCSSGCEADYTTGSGMEQSMALRSYGAAFLNLDDNNFYSYAVGVPTKFTRKITITKPDNNIMKVEVSVDWQDRGEDYNFIVTEYLYNWYTINI